MDNILKQESDFFRDIYYIITEDIWENHFNFCFYQCNRMEGRRPTYQEDPTLNFDRPLDLPKRRRENEQAETNCALWSWKIEGCKSHEESFSSKKSLGIKVLANELVRKFSNLFILWLFFLSIGLSDSETSITQDRKS